MFQHSINIPSTQDYAYVHRVNGPIFNDEVAPLSEPGQAYCLKMKEKLWTSWSGDSYGIRYSDGTPFEADIKGQTFTFRDRMVLRDSKGVVIGVILKMLCRMQPTFKIYGLRPFMEGQVPSEQKYRDRALYTWSVISEKSTSEQRVMTMVDGTEYVAFQDGGFLDPQYMRLTCGGNVCASAKRTNWTPDFEKKSWEITVGPGVDPCLMCCFIAVVDEMTESRKE